MRSRANVMAMSWMAIWSSVRAKCMGDSGLDFEWDFGGLCQRARMSELIALVRLQYNPAGIPNWARLSGRRMPNVPHGNCHCPKAPIAVKVSALPRATM